MDFIISVKSTYKIAHHFLQLRTYIGFYKMINVGGSKNF